MVSHKVAPAIATNNCVVVKPTELTPMTALVLADILYEAGLPPEMLSVVTGWPEDIGDEMITNANIDLITFTGGVPVGKMIAAQGRLQAPGAGARRQRSADHPQRSLRRRSGQGGGPGRGGRHEELRPALHGGQAHPRARRRSPTASCRWCWSGPRRSASATRATARPTSAPWSTRRPQHCSKRACTKAAEAGRRDPLQSRPPGRAAAADRRRPRAARLRTRHGGNVRADRPDRPGARRRRGDRSRCRTPPPSACRRASAPTISAACRNTSPGCRSAPSTSGKCRATGSRCRPSAASRIRATATRKASSRR